MAIYEILDGKGKVLNRIIAEPAFVEANFKGMYRDVTPPPIAPAEVVPVKTLEQKVDELTAKVDLLVTAAAVKP